jgi:MYXO-CTERM domain-containing protein
MRTLFLASTIALLGLSSTAEAHFILKSPLPSNPTDSLPGQNGKPNGSNEASGKGPPPCGPDATPSATPTAVQGGHTLHIDVEETTYHPGWYRFALAVNSRSDFPTDPAVYDSKGAVLDPTKAGGASASADKQLPAKFPVLASDQWDHMVPPTQDWQLDLPIPNFDCPKCTLQIEQFMNQHGSNVGIGGFFYHHCADIKITADPTLPAFTPGADGGTTETHPDAGSDAATSGAGGTGGTAGTSGSNGAAGTSGAAGNGPTTGAGGQAGNSASGQAGNSASGTAGTSGSAGSGTAGTSSSTGAAGRGTTGSHSSGSGGCSVAGNGEGATLFGVAAILGIALSLRRRRS